MLIAGIVIVGINCRPKDDDKINPGIETENENDNDKIKEQTRDDVETGGENENSLPADSIDGSGIWDDTSGGNSQEKQEDKGDTTISDENILIDDKEWGYIN